MTTAIFHENVADQPFTDIAAEREPIALEGEFFIKREFSPDADLPSGIIHEAMDFPTDRLTVLFTIPRRSGWLARWQEMIADREQEISRLLQIYTGVTIRDFDPMEKRARE